MDDLDFILPEEVAGMLPGKTRQSLAVERCKRSDTPPWYKLGSRVFYKRSDVLAWIEKHRVEPKRESVDNS